MSSLWCSDFGGWPSGERTVERRGEAAVGSCVMTSLWYALILAAGHRETGPSSGTVTLACVMISLWCALILAAGPQASAPSSGTVTPASGGAS